MNTTPSSRSAGAKSWSCPRFQAWLASTINRASRRAADGLDSLHRAIDVELDLDDPELGSRGGLVGHRRRVGLETHRHHRVEGPVVDTDDVPDRALGMLRFEVPQRAIDGVPGAAGRQDVEQLLAADGGFD